MAGDIVGDRVDLSNAVAAIRPRSYWAAVDLGVLLVRTWWGPLFKSWLVVTLPIYLLCMFFCYPIDPMLGIFLFWWFLSIWERVPLYVMSAALFDRCPTVKEVVKSLPKIVKVNFFSMLFLRRFSLVRSFNLPVVQLEGIKGKRLSRRLEVLHRDAYHVAFYWLLFCHSLITALFTGVIIVIWFAIPEEFTLDVWSIKHLLEQHGMLLWTAGVYIVLSLVTPFYVAGGFALYLNRRVLLEGWDIELIFRGLAKRAAKIKRDEKGEKGEKGASVSVLPMLLLGVVLSCLSLSLSPQHLSATEVDEPVKSERVVAQKAIDDLLSKPPFVREVTRKQPKFEPDWEDWDWSWDWSWDWWDSEDDKDNGWSLFSSELDAGGLFKMVLIALLIIFLMMLIKQMLAWRHLITERKQRQERNENVSFDYTTVANVRDGKGALPYSRAGVERLWASGRFREAFAMLYQRLLLEIEQQGVVVNPSDTEAELLHKVQEVAQRVESGALKTKQMEAQQWCDAAVALINGWVEQAYGHNVMQNELFLRQCHKWDRELFSEEAAIDG